jgi:hypothetical protein
MLRSSLWILAIFLIVGQAFASVTVYVDMKQTGPKDANGEVLVRVGKNIDATYLATASYNGQPTLYHEETIQSTNWTYTVSADAGVVYSPTQSGTGNSVTVTAKSAAAGTYTITVTFSLTFTIKTPQKDAQGNYVYDVNNNQLFTTRSDGPYSGSGSATLNVKEGKFKVAIEPTDLFRGRRNTLGIGEPAKVVVEKENPSDPSVAFHSMEVYENTNSEGASTNTNSADASTLINISAPSFKAGHYNGIAKIKVWATINNVKEGPETIGVSVIEPNGVKMINVQKIPDPRPDNPSLASVGFHAKVYLLPNTVSFLYVEINEGECPTERDQNKYFSKYRAAGFPIIYTPDKHDECEKVGFQAGPSIEKHNESMATDEVRSGTCPSPPIPKAPPFESGSFYQWNIPWYYRVQDQPKNENKKFIVNQRVDMLNNQGHLKISKGGATETYPP